MSDQNSRMQILFGHTVPEAVGVPGLVDVDKTANLARREGDVLIP